jgi:hypothetical protein
MGVPVVKMKLLAFAIGASFAGAMGVIFAAKQTFIDPSSFGFMESIGILAMVILGGMGNYYRSDRWSGGFDHAAAACIERTVGIPEPACRSGHSQYTFPG